MRIIRGALLISLLVSPLSRFTIPSYSYKDSFDFIEVQPLNLPGGGSTHIRFRVSFTDTKIHAIFVIIRNSVYPDGETIYYIARKADRVDAEFDYDNAYTRENSVLLFQATNCTTRGVVPIITNYPTMYPNNYDEDEFENTYCFTRSKGWVLYYEEFSFKGFEDLYIPDYYHKVDFSDFRIKRTAVSSVDLPYTRASVLIDNYNGLFSDVGTPLANGQKRYLLLDLEKGTNNWYHFVFKDKLYVHKTKLLMSSTPKEGYIETRHFYLPHLGMKDQENYKFQFSIVDLGGAKATFSHRMSVKAPIDIIGNCVDSEYCVSTYNDSPELELGSVEEH